MADSKRPVVLLLKFAAMLCMVALSYTALLYATIGGQDDYLAANSDKMRLLRETLSPKIILIGGSNLAFGLDSDGMSRALARPVVNMGVHFGLGLQFMVKQAAPYLQRGDIVVVVPEYQSFTNGFFYGDRTLLALAACTNQLSPLKGMQAATLAKSLLQANGSIFNYKSGHSAGVYARTSFNRNGDVTAHLALANEKVAFIKPLDTRVDRIAVQYLRDFIAENASHGVATRVIYPCLQRDYYQRNAAAVAMVARVLREEGVQAASSPQDFVYDDGLFYDTVYHLNARGRALRTEKMIKILEKDIGIRHMQTPQ